MVINWRTTNGMKKLVKYSMKQYERMLYMFCPNCGSEIKRGRYCINCGAQILDEDLSPSAGGGEQAARPARPGDDERPYASERPNRPEKSYAPDGYAPRNPHAQHYGGGYPQDDDYDDRGRGGYQKPAPTLNVDFNSIAAKISPKGPFAENPVINAFKKLGNSWLFLSFLAIESLLLLIKLISAFTAGFSNLFGGLFKILGNLGLGDIENYLDSFVDNIFGFFDGIVIVYSLIMLIPSILIGVGIWLTFLESRNISNKKMKTTGMKLINIVVKIRFIAYIVLLAVAEIGVLIWGISSYDDYYGGVSIGIIIAAMVGTGAFSAVKIFYNKLILDATTNIMFVMNKGSFSQKRSLPKALEIFNYIIAGLSLLTIISGSVFANILNIAAIIIISIFMRIYNREMTAVISGRPPKAHREETYQVYPEYPAYNGVNIRQDGYQAQPQPKPTAQSNSFASSYEFSDQ